MRLRPAVACASLPVLLGLACTAASPERAVLVGMNMVAPQALLDGVEAMKLYVADATEATQCTEASGAVSSDLTQPGAARAFDLRRGTADAPCPNSAAFCSEEVTLPTDASRVLVFQAVGFKQGAMYAVGCTSRAVNSNPFYVDLVVHRYVPPAECGNGTIEPGEQCEPPSGDAHCDEQCRSKEVLLSSDNAGPASQQLANAPPKSKLLVKLGWAPAGALHAVFQDNNFSKTGSEINYRQLTADMGVVTSPALLANQIRLPQQCPTTCTVGFEERPFTQAAPSLAVLSDGSVLVAYEDSRTSDSSQSKVALTPFSADAKTAMPDVVDVETNPTPGKLQAPSVAGGPAGKALVVWTDASGGALRGRIRSAGAWAADAFVIGASGASGAKVAGGPSGWRVVWQAQTSEGDVWMTHVSEAGAPAAAQVVNDKSSGVQNQPSIAFAPSGESIVVWNDGGAIMVQRFDQSGVKAPADQKARVNGEGAGEFPAVAGSSQAGGFFAITWQAGGQIYGRFLDLTGGYLFNPVDGQDTAFVVNHPEPANTGPRAMPSVAIGGNGHVAFAWQDESANHFGIWARRIPLPSR